MTTKQLEMPGIEPGTSYMRSTRSTTELHPHWTVCADDQVIYLIPIYKINNHFLKKKILLLLLAQFACTRVKADYFSGFTAELFLFALPLAHSFTHYQDLRN